MDACLYGEWISQFSIVDYPTGGIFIQLPDDVDELWWESVVVHELPNDLSVDTVKGLLEVNEDAVQGGLPLQGLLDDDPHRRYVVSAGSVLAESCLLLPERLV